MKSKIFQYLLPGLLLGALGGYFFGQIAHPARQAESSTTPRSMFLSSEEDSFDYEKLARVCLAVSRRSDGGDGSADDLAAALGKPPVNSAEVQKTKDYLDRLLSNALEKGAWTRMISFRARQLVTELPPVDAAEFANLFRTAVHQGDLQVAPDAWVPETIN